MPRPRIGDRAMTPTERQARRRARLCRDNCASPAPPARRTLSRPQRWAAAVAALIDLRDQYRAWLDKLPASLDGSKLADKLPASLDGSKLADNLPASLDGSKLADKLQAIVELDLEELQAIDIPRGYGRD